MDAQWLLGGHEPSVWRKDHGVRFPIAYNLKQDGQFGPLSATYSKRAKFWLGYANDDLDPTFGQLLYDYLTGAKHITPEMNHRRNARLREAHQKTSGKKKALDWMLRNVGTGEHPPGSNCTWIGRQFGMNCVAWCAICLSVAYADSGSGIHFHETYVPTIIYKGLHGIDGLHVTSSPQPGDLFTYRDQHVGMFRSWADSRHWRFNTVEGNHSNLLRTDTRWTSSISHFIRVGA